MIDNQNGRRNLTDGWKFELSQAKKEILLEQGKIAQVRKSVDSVLSTELESVFSDRAKEQQIRKPESVIQISEEQKPIVAIKEVAKIANVSHDTIAKVKKIEAVASEEVKNRLNSGEPLSTKPYPVWLT